VTDSARPSREELQSLVADLNVGLEALERIVLQVRLSLTQFAVDIDSPEASDRAVKLGQQLAAFVRTTGVVRDAAIMLNNGLP
jgi:hypothetical protein